MTLEGSKHEALAHQLQPSLHSETMCQVLSKTNFTEIKNLVDESLILTPLSQSKTSVQGIEFKVKDNYLMTSYENHKLILLAFACPQKHQTLQKSTKIILWQFKKKDGQNHTMQICGIKGIVSSMRLDLIRHVDEGNENENKDRKVKYSFCLIVGTAEGYLKTVYLRKDYSIKSTKLSTLNPIKQILALESQLWQEDAFCFVLMDNNQIFLINILNFDIICKFHPPILHCKAEYALNLTHNRFSSELLFQSTKGGYFIVWDLSDAKIHRNMMLSKQNQFNRKNLIEMVFPKYFSHELSLNGFLFTETFGRLIIIVDKKCLLRVFSIDLEDRMDFIEVIRIQLPYFSDSKEKIQVENEKNSQQEQYYDEDFTSTYINFRFFQSEMTLYFMLQKEKHSVYKLHLNQYMEYESLQRMKIRNKSLKSIQQFIISDDSKFLIVRDSDSFMIKYFGEDQCVKSQGQQNEKASNNRQRSKQKR